MKAVMASFGRALFAWVWRKWLIDPFTGQRCRVLKVTGWRDCQFEKPNGQRVRVTFIWPLWLFTEKER
jgi:hypothetical protein